MRKRGREKGRENIHVRKEWPAGISFSISSSASLLGTNSLRFYLSKITSFAFVCEIYFH